jgi:hypothetical protein
MVELIKEYKALTNNCKIYQNRIELSYGSGLFGKKYIIPIKNISSIEKPHMLNCVDIKTNDGKKYRIAVTLNPKNTEELRDKILELL